MNNDNSAQQNGHMKDKIDGLENSLLNHIRMFQFVSCYKLRNKNLSYCILCNASGDLLCCDSCNNSYHVECLSNIETLNPLYVPTHKHAIQENGKIKKKQSILGKNDWFCPCCLTPEILSLWHRGIPLFVKRFKGFGEVLRRYIKDNGISFSGPARSWYKTIEEFMQDVDDKEYFPPLVLCAMSGLKRVSQRVNEVYAEERNSSTSIENIEKLRKLLQEEQLSKYTLNFEQQNNIELNFSESTINDTKGISDTVPIVESSVEQKKKLRFARRTRLKTELAVNNDANSEKSTQARLNIGVNHQIPMLELFTTEAADNGIIYSEIANSGCGTTVTGSRSGRNNELKLVYSHTLLKQQAESSDNAFVPITHTELELYIDQVFRLWPVWIVWPPSREFALKLLHHTDYNCYETLKLLCSDYFRFDEICLPPKRPYNNKWKPEDKRREIPSKLYNCYILLALPFPPINAQNLNLYSKSSHAKYKPLGATQKIGKRTPKHTGKLANQTIVNHSISRVQPN